jgi:hypothetical protein
MLQGIVGDVRYELLGCQRHQANSATVTKNLHELLQNNNNNKTT